MQGSIYAHMWIEQEINVHELCIYMHNTHVLVPIQLDKY